MASPPSEPYVRFSRIRLSSWWLLHRDWLALAWALIIVKSPNLAKNAFDQLNLSLPAVPVRAFCLFTKDCTKSTSNKTVHLLLKVEERACLKYPNHPMRLGFSSSTICSTLIPHVLFVFWRIRSRKAIRLFFRT